MSKLELRELLPRVDLIASREVSSLTHHPYGAWEASSHTLQEAADRAREEPNTRRPEREKDREAYLWLETVTLAAIREELLRRGAPSAYEQLREAMRSELGVERDETPVLTPEQLRSRVKLLASYTEPPDA